MNTSVSVASIQISPTTFRTRLVLGVLLLNLNNAKEAILEKHPTGGKITITLDQDGDNIQVRVKDNGGGIPESALAKIFDPYFTTKPKGTGIGLYMSRMIMQHMDGTLAARNADEGMGFSMLFPRTH